MKDKIVDVYVRRGDGGKTRNLSFQPPPEITQDDILDREMAIDGNSVLADIQPYEDGKETLYGHPNFDRRDPETGAFPMSFRASEGARCDGEHATLGSALACAQKGLRGWLGEFGYQVKFN